MTEMFGINKTTGIRYLTALLIVVTSSGFVAAQSDRDDESKGPIVATSDPPGNASEFEPTRVLAIVGGEPIFVGDILFEVNQLIARFMPNAPADIVKRERSALINKMLPKFIEQKLLLIDVKNGLPAEAKFEDIIKSASSDFDEKALEGLMETAGVDSPTMFDAHLRAQGSSLRKLRETWTVSQVVRYFLSEKIKTDAEVSHKEMLDYYRERESDYSLKAKARWEQVMVRHDKFSNTTDAMSAIIDMGNKIVYGASLEGVAKKSSQGYLASQGGQQDWVTKGSLVHKSLDKAIFTLPVGQLSDIIKTDQGFHIIRVIERVDASKVNFVEAQIEIKKKLESEKRLQAYDAHVAKLKKAIPVEIIATSSKPSIASDVRSNKVSR